MDLIAKLTPAETLLLLKTDSTLRDLLKYTMMDLLLQKVLAIVSLPAKSAKSSARKVHYVVTGFNFKSEKPKLHEMIFLYPYYKKQNARILFQHLLRMGYSRAKDDVHYKSRFLLRSTDLNDLVKKGFWQRTLGTIHLSKAGKDVKEKIISYFNMLDRELPKLVKDDPPKARDILDHIRGNVLLLNAFRFDLLHYIGRELEKIKDETD